NSRLRSFVMQDEGGTTKTIAAGVAAVKEMLPEANRVTRTRVPASHIMVGLQCGGSDGFSSITANPALGAAMDILVKHGGTAILSETPEIYGVEHTLTARAVSRAVGEKLLERIRWWKEEYSTGRDVQINGKVSPGNQMGGLANIFEKSLGSSMKGGTTGLMEVYRYAEPVTQPGFVFMDTPGFDPCSATGQIAGGDLPGGRARVEARRVHEDEARLGDRLGVAVHLHQAGGAALHRRAERFLEDVGQA